MGLTKDLGALPRVITVSGNNVGINKTPSAGVMLDVNGTGIFNGSLSTSLGAGLIVGGNSFAFGPSSTRGALHIVGSSDRLLSFGTNGNQDAYLYNSSSITQIVSTPSLSFVSGGPERMRIFSTGNVFIGASPVDTGERLNVNGTVRASALITGLTTYDTNGLTIRNASNTVNLWSINKGAGDGSENWNFYNFSRNSIDFSVNNSTGNVGIGMTPNAARLTVNGFVTIGEFTNGTAWINAEGGAAYFGNGAKTQALWIYNNGNYAFTGSNVSDIRAKKNINNLDFNATEKIMTLKPKSYYMKSDSKQIRYGLIAQEVNEILPDLVCGDINGDDYVGLDYNGVIPILIKAIQEQQEIIKQLTNRIINLENK